MLYTMLIYETEEAAEARSAEELKACLAEHRRLQERSKEAQTFVAANELMSVATATTLRERDGGATVIDGPFAETKEQLVGLYIFDCKDLDEAIAHAKQIPHVRGGAIEIRPIAHFEARPAS